MAGGKHLVAIRGAGAALAAALAQVRAAGDAALPLDPALTGAELARILAVARPHRVLGLDRDALPAPLEVDDDVDLVVATSGTSGEPKLVELTAAALRASAQASVRRLGATPDDRWLCCVPLSGIAGLGILERCAVTGTQPVIHDRFEVHAFAGARDVTLVSLVPTMLARLLDAGGDLSRFRAILLGGARVPFSLKARALHAGAPLVETYGMTETCGGCVYDGVPLDGVRARIASDEGDGGGGADGGAGVIELSGPTLMRRYRADAETTRKTLRDGWLRTSDRGVIGDDGRLTVLGRADDVIVTGGRKVAPAEVEDALLEDPRVLDAAVFPVPDDEWGQRVAAAVVVKDRGGAEEARRSLRERLAGYKVPTLVFEVDAIPRTERGKLDVPALVRIARTQ